MTIQLDYDDSRSQFEKALDMARSKTPLPRPWLERAHKVGESPSRTFLAMLGTALLAKATNPRVDPFSLKTRDFPNAYSARSLCKDVLVPCAVDAGVHIGTTGREPLNNQPFFRHERVDRKMTVRTTARPHLDYLCDCLHAMEKLSRPQALEALAAFLRVRIEEGRSKQPPLRIDHVLEPAELVETVSAFVESDPESGKRGQALVAACLDLIFEDVRTTRVFDPSRHWPGDVVVFHDEIASLSVEVKQRTATGTEILQFAGRCASMNVHRAIAAILHPGQESIYSEDLCLDAWRRYRVHLSILHRTSDVVLAGLTWGAMPLQQALEAFPQNMAARLEELEVSDAGLAAWSALFKVRG